MKRFLREPHYHSLVVSAYSCGPQKIVSVACLFDRRPKETPKNSQKNEGMVKEIQE